MGRESAEVVEGAPSCQPVLTDPRQEGALDADGFLKVPFLDARSVDLLRSGYFDLHPQPGMGFDTDFAYVNIAHKRATVRLITDALEPLLHDTFEDVTLFNPTFVMKWPGEGSKGQLHQDWAYVDESRYGAVTLWIALDDASADLDNGPLCVLKGSHRLPTDWRGANSFGWYGPYREAIEPHLEPLEVRAGDGVIFNNRLLHGSSANRSARPRLAVAAVLAPAAAPLVYAHADGQRWRLFSVDRDFFARHGPVDLRLGPPDDVPALTDEPRSSFTPPVEQLAQLCGVAPESLAPRPHQGPGFSGVPLSGSRAPEGRTPVARLRATIHRRVADQDPGPLLVDPPGSPCDRFAATLPGLRDAWTRVADDRSEWIRRDPGQTGEIWGEWHSVPLHRGGRWLPAADRAAEVKHFFEPVSGIEEVSFEVVGGGTTLMPRQAVRNTQCHLIGVISGPEPVGNAVLQVGSTLVTISPGRCDVVDTTFEHTVWNWSGTACVALVARLRRPMGVGTAVMDRLVDRLSAASRGRR